MSIRIFNDKIGLGIKMLENFEIDGIELITFPSSRRLLGDQGDNAVAISRGC
jgi:hypothetical protein